MQDQNMSDVYLIAPDYAAGHDMTTGFKRYFKNKIAAETYTKFGQSDYQVELSKIRDAKPKAVFAFLPGGMGIQFVKQYAQAGLRETIPLYSVFTVDETTLPAIGDAASGNYEVSFWASDLDMPRNKEFVAAFRQKYGYNPSYYAAQSFDAIAMIDHAVKAVNGDVANIKGMIAALEKADFPSVRGQFTYNKNHFPIENFYLLRIGKDKDGNFVRMIEKKVFDNTPIPTPINAIWNAEPAGWCARRLTRREAAFITVRMSDGDTRPDELPSEDRPPGEFPYNAPHLARNPANYAALTPLGFLERAAACYSDKVAVIEPVAGTADGAIDGGERRFTYRQFYGRCRRFAAALRGRGIGRGDTVSVLAPNVPALLEAHYAVPMTGAVLNALNTGSTRARSPSSSTIAAPSC